MCFNHNHVLSRLQTKAHRIWIVELQVGAAEKSGRVAHSFAGLVANASRESISLNGIVSHCVHCANSWSRAPAPQYLACSAMDVALQYQARDRRDRFNTVAPVRRHHPQGPGGISTHSRARRTHTSNTNRLVAVLSHALEFGTPGSHKDLLDLYGQMTGKGASVSEAYPASGSMVSTRVSSVTGPSGSLSPAAVRSVTKRVAQYSTNRLLLERIQWHLWARTRIALRLTHVERSDHAVDDDRRVALAAQVAQRLHRSRVGHLHPERLGELGASVREEGDDGALDTLIPRPPAPHKNFRDVYGEMTREEDSGTDSTHPAMTAPSLTQYTSTSTTPAALSLSSAAR